MSIIKSVSIHCPCGKVTTVEITQNSEELVSKSEIGKWFWLYTREWENKVLQDVYDLGVTEELNHLSLIFQNVYNEDKKFYPVVVKGGQLKNALDSFLKFGYNKGLD